MFRNYFKTALRNLWRHRTFSLINVMGLTIGMTACFLIFLYVRFEMSYEAFHPKADRIYRAVADLKTPSETINANTVAYAVGPHAAMEMPEIESFCRIQKNHLIVRYGDKKFKEEISALADSTAFNMFGWEMIKGNPQTALNDPFTVVLTESAAKKYFGDEDPMGKTVFLTEEGFPTMVTGIMKDLPENTLVKGSMFSSMASFSKVFKGMNDNWGSYGSQTYFLLKPGTDPKALEKKFPAFLEKNNGEEQRRSKMFPTIYLEPFKDIHLYSTRDENKGGLVTNIYIFSIIAAFILLIACINFVNLTTARSTERAKEVGVRKVVGADRTQLIRQFLGESLIISFIAFALTLFLSAGLLPMFNTLAGVTVSKSIFSNWHYIALLLGAAAFFGLLAGIYPALVLSSFRPIVVLKGRFATGTRGILLRKGLVVTQFTISIALIIATLVVYFQTQYMRSFNVGFNKDQMVVLQTEGDKAQATLRDVLRNVPGVKSSTLSSTVPGGDWLGAYSEIENKAGEMQVANLHLYFVDFDYMNEYNMQMVAGRRFSRDFMTDTTQAMVVNEATTRMFGYDKPQDALGKKFNQWGRAGTIIGVMKDFHYTSLQSAIEPLVFRMEKDGSKNYSKITINVDGNHIPETMAAVEKKWKELIPNMPFSYTFLDEMLDNQYRSEQKFGKLFLNFAVLAILISCLGLLGLTSYSTIQRTKEIGIRKVMGASVTDILHLLSKEFMLLAIVAFCIGVPIAWFFMHKWLQEFAYRIDIGWWMFALAGTLSLLIGLFTISFMAVKAAVANPVKSLRTE
ncbi:FtsX-like permease family protein [Pseudoflavitalea sp. G-6-1-2]|uniref:ABC transporter permease n=1 Tax=Pseudoflavitalea sp. G-6-1-2 TaxID=2728841 RepID=UPI00146F131D|nr:ABC transporter permease [Pseudoflavitalea sp. G-6-1-2]NML23668.1 FtsX-like permease family protein [Pseudoflavitalea sp. G-6-1-2]